MDKKIFPDEPEIPILPNLFTAGNLVCGFFAILTIFEGINQADSDAVAAFAYYQNATFLIFAACLFDLFDGRIARMRGRTARSAGSSIPWRTSSPSASLRPCWWPRRCCSSFPRRKWAGASASCTCCAPPCGWRASTAWLRPPARRAEQRFCRASRSDGGRSRGFHHVPGDVSGGKGSRRVHGPGSVQVRDRPWRWRAFPC